MKKGARGRTNFIRANKISGKNKNKFYWTAGILILALALIVCYIVLFSNTKPRLDPPVDEFTAHIDEYEPLGFPDNFLPTIGYFHTFGDKLGLWNAQGQFLVFDGDSWSGPNTPNGNGNDGKIPAGFKPIIGYYHPISGGRIVLWDVNGEFITFDGTAWSSPARPNGVLNSNDGKIPAGFKPSVGYSFKGRGGNYNIQLWDSASNSYYNYNSVDNKWTGPIVPEGTSQIPTNLGDASGFNGKLFAGRTPVLGYFYNINSEEGERVISVQSRFCTAPTPENPYCITSLRDADVTVVNIEDGTQDVIDINSITFVNPSQIDCDGLPNSASMTPDLNGDSIINQLDISIVIDGALGLYNSANAQVRSCLDIDKNGAIGAADVQLVINYALGVELPLNYESSELVLWYSDNGRPYVLTYRMVSHLNPTGIWEGHFVGDVGAQYGVGLPGDQIPDVGYVDPLKNKIVLWYGDETYESEDGRLFIKTRGEITEIPNCVDSDIANGNTKNYGIKGTVSSGVSVDYINLANSKDQCITGIDGTNVYSGPYLREYYCENNFVKSEEIQCEGSCNDGACGSQGICTLGRTKCTNRNGVGYLYNCFFDSDLNPPRNIWGEGEACLGDKTCTDISNNDHGLCNAPEVCATEGDERCKVRGQIVEDTIELNEEQEKIVNGVQYVLTLSYIDALKVKFTVNAGGIIDGIITSPDISNRGTWELADGTLLSVKEIRYQAIAGGRAEVDYTLGAQTSQVCAKIPSHGESLLWINGGDACSGVSSGGEGSGRKCPAISEGSAELPAKTRLRIDGTLKYCDPRTFTYETVVALGNDCDNDYECNSNVCIEGTCKALGTQITEQTSLLNQILCWLRHPIDATLRGQCIVDSASG